MSTKAITYLRVSGKAQIEGDGFPRQREVCERYAAAHDIEIVDEYRDEGVSGTRELDDRAGLSALFSRLASNGIRLVLVERADRVARDLMVSEIILKQFRDLEVRVIAAADGGNDLTSDSSDPTATLIRQVLGAVAEFEKSVLTAKLRAARQRKKRLTGRCEGAKPYGDREGEDRVIARILRWRAEGLSYNAITDRLNQRHVPTRLEGAKWSRSLVYSIIQRSKTESIQADNTNGSDNA